MRYRFKPLPELYWGVTIAAALVLLQALFTLEPEKVTDWRGWAIALGGAMLRPAAGAAIDWIRRSMTEEPEPTLVDQILALAPSDRIALVNEIERRRRIESGVTSWTEGSTAGLVTRQPTWLPEEPR